MDSQNYTDLKYHHAHLLVTEEDIDFQSLYDRLDGLRAKYVDLGRPLNVVDVAESFDLLTAAERKLALILMEINIRSMSPFDLITDKKPNPLSIIYSYAAYQIGVLKDEQP